MQRVLAYHVMDVATAFLLAVGVVVAWASVSAAAGRAAFRRLIRELAQVKCPACGTQVGETAMAAGNDVSPMEELWCFPGSEFVHHYPVCREAQCGSCGA